MSFVSHILTSATFWADLLAVAGIVATVIVGLKALPRRRLRFAVVSRTRLMNAPQVIRDSLKVFYKEQALADPYVMTFEIASTGRSAIPTVSFDAGRSLQLDLAAEIKTILSIEYKPASATKPVIESSGNTIELKPELIARREIINASILTEGNPGTVAVTLNPFTDVKIDVTDLQATQARRTRWLVITAAALAPLTLAAVLFAAYNTLTVANRNKALSLSALCVTLTEFAQSTSLGMQLVDRDITVVRAKSGSIQSIKFSPTYATDVGILEDAGHFLIAEYKVENNSGSRRVATKLSQVLATLPKLPHEGVTANHDIAEFKTVMNQISNPNLSTLGC